MKNLKVKKSVVIIICIVIVIAVACLLIFKTRNIADIISIDNPKVTIVSATIFNAPDEGKYVQVFTTKDASDVKKVEELLSSATAQLVGWKPLTGALPLYSTEKDIYALVLDDGTDYNKVLDYANGYLYYNSSKYKITAEDEDKFLKDLLTLCADSEKNTKQ